MAKGFDDLIEFLLAEIALCGVPGATSADFRRFIQNFYQQSKISRDRGNELGPIFYDRVWAWISSEEDVRIWYRGQACNLTLPEFEAFEIQENGGSNGEQSVARPPLIKITRSPHTLDGSGPTLSFQQSLRQRLHTEGYVVPSQDVAPEFPSCQFRPFHATVQHDGTATEAPDAHNPQPTPNDDPEAPGSLLPPEEQDQEGRQSDFVGPKVIGTARGPRKVPKGYILRRPVFEAPDPDIKAPRIYVSQSRMWYALTSHEMDYKKVPAMQLMLLSIIAAHGADGILQPDLVRLSSQDKRSVPARTDELAKHGYIEKISVNQGMRTSLCIHKKFVKEGRFVKGSDKIEDVFHNRTMVVSNFVGLLYRVLQETPLFPMRDLRKRLGLTMQQWHGRAVRTLIYRLEESGFLVRKRVNKKSCKNALPVVLKLLRAPNEDDVKALSSGRRAIPLNATEKILEEDEDGDEMMRDLDLDLESESEEETDDRRIPPQWEPDRFIANLIFDAVSLSGINGCDSTKIREKTMGKFWKRPGESHLCRLTDHWETSQPLELRHLSLIRDTTVTSTKKFAHYVYRSYGNFKGAVDAGHIQWEAVSREASKLASMEKRGRPKVDKEEAVLNEWGFQKLGFGDFYRRVGSSTLAEARTAMVGRRRPKEKVWDLMGFGRRGRPAKPKTSSPPSPSSPQPVATTIRMRKEYEATTDAMSQVSQTAEQTSQADDSRSSSEQPNRRTLTPSRTKGQLAVPLLSSDQRKALGLPPRGRLGLDVEEQIKAHRRMTGDPSSLPDVILKGTAESSKTKSNKQKYRRKPQTEPKLFTKAFRKKHGLPENGRLKQSVIDYYRGLEEGGVTNGATTNGEPEGSGSGNEEGATPPLNEASDSHQLETGHATALQVSSNALVESPTTTSGKRKATSSGDGAKRSKRHKVSHTLPASLNADGNNVADSAAIALNQTIPATRVENSASQTETGLPGYSGPYRLAVASSLSAGDKAILDKFTKRTQPGVYLDPLATRLGGKGRPKKAFLVIIKSSRLSDVLLEWTAKDPYEDVLSGASTTPLASPPSTKDRNHTSTVASSVTVNNVHSQASADKERRPSLHLSPDVTLPRGNHTDDSVAGPCSLPPQTLASTSWNAINVPRSTTETAVRLSNMDRSDQPSVIASVEMGGTANMVNDSSELSRHPDPPGREDPSSREHLMDDASTSVTPNAVEDDADVTELPRTHTQPLGNDGMFTSRGVVLGRGNVWRLRTSIILDIIERCNGVFPLNGEIILPFWTLWEQRVGKNMVKPERSTLTKTINTLVEGENNKIKKIAFRVPSADRSLTYERFLVAWTSIPPNDQRIRDLQINMIKAYPKKYFPEGIRDLCTGPEPEYTRKVPLPAIDPSIDIDAIYPNKNKFRQRNRKKGPDDGHAPRDKVAYSLLKPRGDVRAKGRPKRQRLDTLNDGLKIPHRHRIQISTRAKVREGNHNTTQNASPTPSTLSESEPESESEVESDSSEDIPLAWSRPVRPINSAVAAQKILDDMSSSSESQYSSDDDLPEVEDWSESGMEVEQKDQFVHLKASAPTARRKFVAQTRMLNPAVKFYPTNGTFSTDPILNGVSQTGQGTRSVAIQSELSNSAAVPAPKTFEFVFEKTPWLGRKGLFSTEICINAGTLDPAVSKGQTQQRAGKRKRVRFAEASIVDVEDEEESRRRPKRQRFMLDEYQDDESGLSDSNEESNHTRRRSRKRRIKKGKSSQKGRKPYPEPTLTERLSGLTGNPDDLIYFMPRKKKGFNRWRVDPTLQKDPKPRRVVRESDSSEHFPRLCFTLVIAYCMSGDEGSVEWDTVETVYRSEPSFSLPNTKSLWRWMQINMAQEVQTLTNDFQTAFLDAYAAGKVDSIDDPKTYDWAALVRWAMRTFEHPQARLPETKEAFGDYCVEDSQYLQFDAVDWNIQSYSYVNRAQRALKYAYASPIHTKPARASSDDISRARSWVRSNTATLQEHYSGTQAHSKFKQLDTPLLERVVNEMVEKKILRMRKIKRLLPGRNFDFTATLAMKYRRMFELDVFTQAASLKASLDSAFANEDPSKRAFPLSRTAPDGAVMAVLSLLNEGRIKLIPKLPPVDNGLRAPAPRLSVWGFQPCQYSSRAIPREQLFWGVKVVPTSTYQFGNPLDPSPSPVTRTHQNVHAPASPEPEWKDLSPPPLPGKTDDNALLPIWSSFDGQEVTWPWWYRILNLVMQALVFQPGATAPEIHRHCTSIATELFEVELVLNWLVDVGAAKASQYVNAKGEVRTAYETLPGFYAVFGRELKGQDKEDWFGEKVKRNKTNEIQIRGKAPSAYNLRFRRVGALLRGETVGDAALEESPQAIHADEEVVAQVDGDTPMTDAVAVAPTIAVTGLDGTHDTDMDVDGEWDVDAEGEDDDEMIGMMSPVMST